MNRWRLVGKARHDMLCVTWGKQPSLVSIYKSLAVPLIARNTHYLYCVIYCVFHSFRVFNFYLNLNLNLTTLSTYVVPPSILIFGSHLHLLYCTFSRLFIMDIVSPLVDNMKQAFSILTDNYGQTVLTILLANFILIVLYFSLLPKPLPGIPYNHSAARSLLGDLPALKSHLHHTHEFWSYPASQARLHASPIVQLFIRPFSRPWIIVSDPREAADILLRRSRAFDRSPIVRDWFRAANPAHHIGLASADPAFRRNRALLGGLMAPAFLGDVVTPVVWDMARELVRLWGLRAVLADGRPWDAARDAYDFALDAIWGVLVPEDEVEVPGLVRNGRFLADLESPESGDRDVEVQFENVKHTPIRHAFLKVADSLELVLKSAVPRLYGMWLRYTPSMRKVYELRFKYFKATIDKAVARLKDEQKVRCVVDEVLRKEIILAEKEGRQPSFHAEYVEAEVSRSVFIFRLPQGKCANVLKALRLHHRRLSHHI